MKLEAQDVYKLLGPWGLAQVVKGWGGFVKGSKFKSR